MDKKTDFLYRYLNNDLGNGIIGAGFICMNDIPAGLSLGPHPYYSCSLVLNDTVSAADAQPFHGWNAGDVLQLFPDSDGIFPNSHDASPYSGTLFPESCDVSPNSCRDSQNSPRSPLYQLPSDTVIFHVCFGADTYYALSSCGLLLPDSFFHITLESHLDGWMPSLIQELKNTPQDNLSEVYLNIQKFIIHLHRPLINATNSNREIIDSAKQLLYEACFSKLSFPEIAASVGLGYENFRKIFKEETGISPLQYVLEVKFHYAQRLLNEGMSVKETAAAVGYADPYIFSKQFKKYIGESPSHYKKKG